jgi:hypothetical protein
MQNFVKTRAVNAVPLVITSLLLGAVVALDVQLLTLACAGLLFISIAFLVLSGRWLLQALFILVFLIQGTVQYFFSVRSAAWLGVIMTGLVFLKVISELPKQNTEKFERASGTDIILALTLYVACFVFSLVANQTSLSQALSSVKSVFPFFFILLAFFIFRFAIDTIERLWKMIVIIALVQLPFVMYQHFFIANARKTQGFDSVVGTFGGTPEGGGLNAMLVLFVISAMTFATSRTIRQLCSRSQWALICVVGVAIVLLGEVKAAFLWIPISMLVILRKKITKDLMSFIGYGLLATIFMVGIYSTYKSLYWGARYDKGTTVIEKLDNVSSYFFDSSNINYATGEISRAASIVLWARDPLASNAERLIGFGPGASKSVSLLGKGIVARRYHPLNIDSTGLAVLLWDVGLIGAVAYVSLLVLGIISGWRYIAAGNPDSRWLSIVDTSLTVLILCLTLLFYNRSLMDEPTAQLLCMFCVGCIVQAKRYAKNDASDDKFSKRVRANLACKPERASPL